MKKKTAKYRIVSKRINTWEFTKEVKDLYNENHKKLLKEFKDTNKWKHMSHTWIGKFNNANVNTTRSNLQIQYNPYQNPNDDFGRNKKKILSKNSYGSSNNPSWPNYLEKEKTWKTHTF